MFIWHCKNINLLNITFFVILVISAKSYPRPNTTDNNFNLDARSAVRFPNSTNDRNHQIWPRPRPIGSSVHSRIRNSSHSNDGNIGTNTRIAAREGSEGFVFPEDRIFLSTTQRTTLAPKINDNNLPQCSSGLTFCESVDDYPSTYIENVLKKSGPEFRTVFGNDEIEDVSLLHRIDTVEEASLCASTEQIVYPKVAKNKDNNWLYIVNQGNYVQGIRVEKCLRMGNSNTQSCSFTEGFPVNYRTFCKQKYIYRKLLALNNENGKVMTDTFQIPSCCSCTVRAEGLNSRVGGGGFLSRLPPKTDKDNKPSEQPINR